MPIKRKRKAPAKKRNTKAMLPKQWTTAKVRVNPQGKVQIKIAPNKVKSNSRPRRKSRPAVDYRPRKRTGASRPRRRK